MFSEQDYIPFVIANRVQLKAANMYEKALYQAFVANETSAVRHQVQAHERYGVPLRLSEPWPGILAQAQHLVGVPHHAGLHCGGVVITPEPIRDLVPIHPAANHIDLEADSDDEAPPPSIPIPAIAWE